MTIEELVGAWGANDGVNHALLDLCGDEHFELKPGKGKTIRSNFVHIVGVRRAHAEETLKAEAGAIPKLDWKTATREDIKGALDLSCAVMSDVFRRMEETRKPARWSVPLFFGYCVAHEAHHRSQIEIALRLGGAEPEDEAVLYGLWDWPKIAKGLA